MFISYIIYNCYCILVFRRWKHASFLNSKQNYGSTGCFTKIEKTPRFILYPYYIQTRTFIKMFVPQYGTNKKYYKEKKLIG